MIEVKHDVFNYVASILKADPRVRVSKLLVEHKVPQGQFGADYEQVNLEIDFVLKDKE